MDKLWHPGDAASANARSADAPDRYELITTPEAFLALREEWNQLCARVPGHRLGQTFDWAWLCWRTVAGPRGRRLACVVARRCGRAVLVWPLAVARDGQGGAVARPLDSETSEYSEVLVEVGPQAEQRVASALRVVRRARVCDRLELPNVRADSALGRVLASWPAGTRAMRLGSLDAVSVSWRGIDSWEQYAATAMDAHERAELRRKKRRLDERGQVRIEALCDAGRCVPAIDWSLAQKLEWLQKTGRRNEWIMAPAHRAFLESSMAVFGPSGRRVIFVLRLDEEILATLLSSVDDVRMEWFMIASHSDYWSLSPVQILREHVLRWACERRLECDFRMGDQRWKSLWGNCVAHTSTYVIANSLRGRAYVLVKRARRALATHVPPRLRVALKAFVDKTFAQRA